MKQEISEKRICIVTIFHVYINTDQPPHPMTTTPTPDHRRYRVLWRHTENGRTGVLFPGPLTHAEACTCKSKVTPQDWREDYLEEIKTTPDYSAQFPTPTADLTPVEQRYQNLCQIRQIGCFAQSWRSSLCSWLLCNPATVDRLCKAYGLRPRGSVAAGVRELLKAGRRLYENVNPDRPY